MREVGVGIANADILKIPVADANFSGKDTDGDGLSDIAEDALGTDKTKADTDDDGFSDKVEILSNNDPLKKTTKLPIDSNFILKQKGKIFIQTQRHGEAWYVNPGDGKRYFLGQSGDAYNVMRSLAIGITNANLAKVGYTEIAQKDKTAVLPVIKPIQPIENEAEAGGLKDCENDEKCFLDSASECTPAKLNRSISFNIFTGTKREDSYYEIQGVKNGKCILHTKLTDLEIKYSDYAKNQLLQSGHTQEELNKQEVDASARERNLIGRTGICELDTERGYYYGVRDVLSKIKQHVSFERDMRPYACSGLYFEPVRTNSICNELFDFPNTGYQLGSLRHGYYTDYKQFSIRDIDTSNNLTVEVDKVRDVISYLQTKTINGLVIKNFGHIADRGRFIRVELNCN